ncbi:Mur ligase family protein [Methanobacterium paludis]|uniref:Mur ligase middle domain protein n=1 Tax=Methanobacterium paludis (strain DSM 25820 / JCM 18151 / SWAN1) TaxID=868131 RepID=F6D448_METPW|nr:Mur ligase family protein [Methanobacterium paludis]AEG17470.1 Mur ligase middle domain protein [Methanobacterium paludis]
MDIIKTSYLADKVNGKLIGPDKEISGIFNFLNTSKRGDAVIRHWIDEKGVEIAVSKGVSCIITQNPQGNAIETAKKLKFPLIITEKIELANAFAISWAVENFATDSIRIVVTGTNGKSTTTHMIYSILKEAGYNTYTNTDSKSEFNTLIDPIVSKQIAEFPDKIEAMVVEVSEVQGWLGKLMKNHASLMTSAIDPNVVVLTNVALDHIGLVNSVEEAFDEISGSIKALKKPKKTIAVLNHDDPLIRKMENFKGNDTEVIFYGEGAAVESKAEGIFYEGKLLIKKEDLPFKSQHFIQNTMAAIEASLSLNVDLKYIKSAVTSYKPLKRRFNILSQNPLIIDDFAHNPNGIVVTINSAAKITKGKLCLVTAIRGSRGDPINLANAEAIVKGLKGLEKGTNFNLIITTSTDFVDKANVVKNSEKDVFLNTLEKEGLSYIFHETLHNALKAALKSAGKEDTILLIGAQGMDPASDVLRSID